MNVVQNFIDRQLGLYYHFNCDNVLKRLVVNSEESFYGLQNSFAASFDQDPPIFACRFSDASGYEHVLALANEDGRVAIQDTSKPAGALEGFQCHNNAVFDLAWMPAHRNFVTVSGDHTAALWDTAESTPKRVHVFSGHTRSVKTAAFRPTEPTVFATGARDGHILIWDIRVSNRPSLVIKPDNCLMNCHSCFTPKTANPHGKRLRLDNHRAISITGLVFRDEDTLVSCGECDGNIKVWDLRKNYNLYTREPLPKHAFPYCGSSTRNGYTNLVVDRARIRLYASCMDNVIYCFNVATYGAQPEQRYTGHENGTFYIKASLSPDCGYLVSGSSDKSAYIWNVRSPQPVVRLAGHRAEVTCAAWRRGVLATCSDDARHMIWRLGPDHDGLQPGAEPPPPGRAHAVPRRDKRAAPDGTPTHNKRARRYEGARSKRCLADLMAAARPDDPDEPPPPKRPRPDPQPAAPFTTPTKNYEKRACRKLSPRSPKPISPREAGERAGERAAVRVSPSKVRVVSFSVSSPTRDLPDFVAHGEAPHLLLMSPPRKKLDTTDWLTLLARERRTRPPAPPSPSPAPLSPRDAASRRNPPSDRTANTTNKHTTLMNYFKVMVKEK